MSFSFITFSQQVIMWESKCLPFKIKVSGFFQGLGQSFTLNDEEQTLREIYV